MNPKTAFELLVKNTARAMGVERNPKIALFLRRACMSILGVAVSTAFTGCQSVLRFPAPGSHWETSIGQLQYVTPERSVIGEAVVSRDGSNDFQLDFMAGPGVPLMRLRMAGETVRAEGLFARGSWQGTREHLRGRLGSWGALSEIFAALDARRGGSGKVTAQSPTGAARVWTAQAEGGAGQPRRVRVTFPKSGERFVFVFAQ